MENRRLEASLSKADKSEGNKEGSSDTRIFRLATNARTKRKKYSLGRGGWQKQLK